MCRRSAYGDGINQRSTGSLINKADYILTYEQDQHFAIDLSRKGMSQSSESLSSSSDFSGADATTIRAADIARRKVSVM